MEIQLPTVLEVQVDNEPKAMACLLEYAKGASVAMAIHAGVELVEHPQFVPVPGMPDFALGLMSWQGRRLPLIDLNAYLTGGAAVGKISAGFALVVAYQAMPRMPIDYGALAAPFLVRMIEVSSSQACELPPQDVWQGQDIALSSFLLQDRVVPIIDVAKVFTWPKTSRNSHS